MTVGRNKKCAFAHYVDRFCSRIESWNLGFLSIRGKETLIKLVLQALPVMPCSVFFFSKSLCAKLGNVLNHFRWRNAKSLKGVHWSSWRNLCAPKSVGSLDFRDFAMFNLSLPAKQCWRIWTQPDCLFASVLKSHYYPKSEFLTTGLGTHPSLT